MVAAVSVVVLDVLLCGSAASCVLFILPRRKYFIFVDEEGGDDAYADLEDFLVA